MRSRRPPSRSGSGSKGPSIERLHDVIAVAGFTPTERHREIHLGNPQRAA
jgi:hypothetical protein